MNVSKTLYVQLQPERGRYSPDIVTGMKVGGVTQKRPKRMSGDCLLVRVNLTIPASAFNRLFEAQIDIPETAVEPVIAEVVE